MANNLSAFNAQAWSKRLITKLDPLCIFLALVNRDWEGELQNIGDTVQVRTPGNITMSSYTRGGTVTYQDLQPVREAMVIADAQSFSFLVDDLDKAQNDLHAMDIYTRRAAVALRNTIDTKIASFIPQASTLITGAASAPITLTSANLYGYFVQARTILGKNNVPTDGRWAVISPDDTALLLQDTTHFIRSTDFGDQVVKEGMTQNNGKPGFIGKIAGFEVYESNHLPVDGSNNHWIGFGDDSFISYAAQLKEMEMLRLQTTFADAVRGLLLHDCHVFAECAKRGVGLLAAVGT